MGKYLILDRDGTINKDRDYVYKVEDLVLLPRAIEGLQKFRDAGYKFCVITNRAGIARGFYKVNDMHRFHRHLRGVLGENGIDIEAFCYCPHHPEITGSCHCRKPKIRLVMDLAKRFLFDPRSCLFIGDKDSDIQLGINCGGLTVLIENGQYQNTINPHFRAKDLSHAFEILSIAQIV